MATNSGGVEEERPSRSVTAVPVVATAAVAHTKVRYQSANRYKVIAEHVHLIPELGGPRNVQGAFGFGGLVAMPNGNTKVSFDLDDIHVWQEFESEAIAGEYLERLRREYNGYRCWWWREDSCIVFLHRLRLKAPMYFDDSALGEQAATAYLWYPTWDGSRWYARAYTGQKHVYAHQYVAQQHGHQWKVIDHKNRDATLDNRIGNLRSGAGGVNRRNCARGKNNTSGFTGVYYNKKNQAWIARIMHNGKTRSHSFSVAAYGSNDVAKQFAIDYRILMAEQFGNTNGLPSASSKRTARQAELDEDELLEDDYDDDDDDDD